MVEIVVCLKSGTHKVLWDSSHFQSDIGVRSWRKSSFLDLSFINVWILEIKAVPGSLEWVLRPEKLGPGQGSWGFALRNDISPTGRGSGAYRQVQTCVRAETKQTGAWGWVVGGRGAGWLGQGGSNGLLLRQVVSVVGRSVTADLGQKVACDSFFTNLQNLVWSKGRHKCTHIVWNDLKL